MMGLVAHGDDVAAVVDHHSVDRMRVPRRRRRVDASAWTVGQTR